MKIIIFTPLSIAHVYLHRDRRLRGRYVEWVEKYGILDVSYQRGFEEASHSSLST